MGQVDNYINNIENRKSLPSMPSFFYICEYLNVTPKEFFDGETVNPTLLNELIRELEPLSDKVLEHILGLVRELRSKDKGMCKPGRPRSVKL